MTKGRLMRDFMLLGERRLRVTQNYRGLRTTSITFSDAIGRPSFKAGW